MVTLMLHLHMPLEIPLVSKNYMFKREKKQFLRRKALKQTWETIRH